jgi:hypothetical protein
VPPPRILASQVKANVKALQRLGDADASAIRSEAADAIAVIDASLRTEWLPIEVDVTLTHAVAKVAGPERLLQWSQDAIAESASGPFMGPIIDALRRTLLTPHTALKRAPYVWSLVYRHSGALTYARVGDREARLVLTGAPPPMDDPVYLLGIQGSFHGAVEMGGGATIPCPVERSGHALVFPLRWTR